ncbi:MAG: DsbA family protein [Burkholderiales bacterium]
MDPIRISCFSDILCVWAYVAQVRLDELKANFTDGVMLDTHFVSIFGNARQKLEARWQDKGGLRAYSAHVRQVASQYPHVVVHPDVWVAGTPTSSLSCHLFLCAVRVAAREGGLPDAMRAPDPVTWAMRRAFFAELADVSDRSVQFGIAETCGVPAAPVEAAIRSGAAYAELSRDLDLARELNVTVSPTLIFNEGRQRLNGNVGYRVIDANLRELLRKPDGEQSWC